MFSFIDAFFDQPKEQLLKSLPFEEAINAALLHFAGDIGTLLRNIIAHERGDWNAIQWPELAAFQAQTSMRDVEPAVHVWVPTPPKEVLGRKEEA